MVWRTEEFGVCHEGIAGAVLADGTEPKPVYLDIGSACAGHETGEWWAYDGTMGRPQAAAFRGSCACGWRGTSYQIDWDQLGERRLYDLDTSSPHHDWIEHIRTVEHQTVPLPTELTDLIDRLQEQLLTLAGDAPAAALKAVAALERITRSTGREAAYAAEADEQWETLGKALGLSPGKARARVHGYLLS
ncbi:MAG: hypothetical protein JO362_04065 [Streptomycetaceae bacterium]|nr:hypothetical protein [Streptomycetaceae bacterium]